MREIKFRAWDKDNKEMLYQGWNTTHNNGVMGCRIVFDELGFDGLVRRYGEDKYEYRDNCELMQYTGLHDKNGKEIYEGDILRHKWNCGYNTWLETISVVKWHKGAFVVDDKKREDWLLSLHACADNWAEVEVIGNRWDNSELLKEVE